MTLFAIQVDAPSEQFRRLLEDHRAEDRARLDAMFERARPHLDRNFIDQFARHTNQRFFELRLAITLLDRGFELVPNRPGQPDFGITLPEKNTLWVEAIGLSWGQANNPDRPPPLGPRLQPTPIRQALLRHTGALKEKRDKFRTYLCSGTVAAEDCRVVAINSGGLHPHAEGVGLPRIVSAVLPFGEETITIDRATGDVIEAAHEYRPEIRNAREQPIATTAFLDPDNYGIISAVLHDTAYLPTWPGGLQPNRWTTVHNPTAPVKLPAAMFDWTRRFSVEIDNDGTRLIEAATED